MKAPPPELCFGRIIYIDCSKWANKRTMQKKIAQELRLDHKTMAMFDEQDEEDDFSGVDRGSRDVIRSVEAVIDQTLRKSRFMMIFIYGSHDEVVLSSFGVPENSDCVIVWTFSTRVMTIGCNLNYQSPMKTANKLRSTDVVHYSHLLPSTFPSSEVIALFREEAANIVARHPTYMRGIDLTTVVDCCLYGLLLYHNFRSTTGFVWPTHAPNYWICDGIIKGDRAWEISNALQPEITFECNTFKLEDMFKKLKEDLKTHFLVVKDDDDVYEKRPYRWISTTLRNKEINDDMQIILARASSVFLAFETKDSPRGLPNDFFKQCNKLGVLVLTCCAFSFVSPPFLHCHTLRFLGLDHCTDNNNPIEPGGGSTTGTEWAFLKSLLVIDLYYTDWSEILSEEKINLMDNLMEANIEGVRWPWWTSQQLQKRLTYLRRLRIIRPMYDEAAETASSDDIAGSPFTMDNTSLEILDLSGCNKGIGRNLPTIISKASHLEVLILDGCRGLEHIVISDNPSLRSFSFDGYGPASHRTSTAELPSEISRPKHRLDEYKKGGGLFETSVVSLKGCTQVDNLFLRGLPNLEELDLSGCAIKVLDFGSMVMDVPWLERLFLVGCDHLRAVIWGPEPLELICIDTRPWSCARPPSHGAYWQQYLRLRVHAIAADARLARSLWDPIHRADSSRRAFYFNISITSSSDACSGVVVQSEETSGKEMMITGSTSDIQPHYGAAYDDVFTKVVGDGGGLAPPMQAFPQAPTEQLDRHVEIGPGSLNVQSEVELYRSGNNLAGLLWMYTQSVHIHDVSAYTNTMPPAHWCSLMWCRVERCPNLVAVFPPESEDIDGNLRTIWASDLLKARCIWSKDVHSFGHHFKRLRHLHLRRCPRLQFALAMSSRPSFPWLETLHCGNLRHVFVAGNEEHRHPSVWCPELTAIHLHDVPALREMCEAAEMVAPALETIRIRGCWSLRRLPALKPGKTGRRPTVEIEKDVWDALEWDGVDAGHHPSLYEPPVHSDHYKRRTLRRSVLR